MVPPAHGSATRDDVGRDLTADPYIRWYPFDQDGRQFAACYVGGGLLHNGPEGWFTIDTKEPLYPRPRPITDNGIIARARACAPTTWPILPDQERLFPVANDGWPDIDEAAFLGAVGEYAIDSEPETEADRVAVLVSLLVMAATAVGPGPYILAGNDRHPARLFAVIVGDTFKGGKGTSYSVAYACFAEAFPELIDRIMGGFGSGERVIDMVAAGAADNRLLIFEEEFARFLRIAGREGSIASPIVRSAWDGRLLQTRARAADAVAVNHHICFLGHITRPELGATLSDNEVYNGFSNRFMWALARRSRLLPEGGNVPDSIVHRSATKLRERVYAARNLNRLYRSEPAERYWEELYYRLAEDNPAGLLNAAVSRDAQQCLRLSLLYALLDRWKENQTIVIERRHIEAAAALWDYCRESAAVIFGLGNGIADRLLAALRAAGTSGLDQTAQHDLFRHNVSAAELDGARSLLKTRGLALERTEAAPARGGRPRVVLVAI